MHIENKIISDLNWKWLKLQLKTYSIICILNFKTKNNWVTIIGPSRKARAKKIKIFILFIESSEKWWSW